MSTTTEPKRPPLPRHPQEGTEFVTALRGWIPAEKGSAYDEVPVTTRTYGDGTIDVYVGGWRVNRTPYKTVAGARARVNKEMAGVPETVTAPPYTAAQCPECKVWVLTSEGPFSEGDRTKSYADWLHWRDEHLDPTTADESRPQMFPYFFGNKETVTAVRERRLDTPKKRV